MPDEYPLLNPRAEECLSFGRASLPKHLFGKYSRLFRPEVSDERLRRAHRNVLPGLLLSGVEKVAAEENATPFELEKYQRLVQDMKQEPEAAEHAAESRTGSALGTARRVRGLEEDIRSLGSEAATDLMPDKLSRVEALAAEYLKTINVVADIGKIFAGIPESEIDPEFADTFARVFRWLTDTQRLLHSEIEGIDWLATHEPVSVGEIEKPNVFEFLALLGSVVTMGVLNTLDPIACELWLTEPDKYLPDFTISEKDLPKILQVIAGRPETNGPRFDRQILRAKIKKAAALERKARAGESPKVSDVEATPAKRWTTKEANAEIRRYWIDREQNYNLHKKAREAGKPNSEEKAREEFGRNTLSKRLKIPLGTISNTLAWKKIKKELRLEQAVGTAPPMVASGRRKGDHPNAFEVALDKTSQTTEEDPYDYVVRQETIANIEAHLPEVEAAQLLSRLDRGELSDEDAMLMVEAYRHGQKDSEWQGWS